MTTKKYIDRKYNICQYECDFLRMGRIVTQTLVALPTENMKEI